MFLDVNLDRGKPKIDPSMVEPVVHLDRSTIQVNFQQKGSKEISFCSRRASNPDIAYPVLHRYFEAREGNTSTMVVRSRCHQSRADSLVRKVWLFPRREKVTHDDRCRGSRI